MKIALYSIDQAPLQVPAWDVILDDLTRWGRSQVHTQAVNDAQMVAALARSLGDELRRVDRRLAHVMAPVDTGAANQPFLRG